VMRETSVLGRRLAGRGRRSRTFLTIVIEGEDEDVMESRVCRLECVGGESEGETCLQG